MTSFLAELIHTDASVTCQESGFMDLSSALECSGAVTYARSFNSKARYISDTFSMLNDNQEGHPSSELYQSLVLQ